MDSKFKGGYSRMTGCTAGNHPEYDRGFRNGQQSKQAEIDVLQEKISKVLYAIAQSELHGDRAIWGIQDEIKEILK